MLKYFVKIFAHFFILYTGEVPSTLKKKKIPNWPSCLTAYNETIAISIINYMTIRKVKGTNSS